MEIGALFSKDAIDTDLRAGDKDETIREMVDLLHTAGALSDKEVFMKEIYAREALGTTAFDWGIAIPHGKSPAVKKTMVAYGRSKAGVEYGGSGKSHYFFMIASGDEGGNTHLQALAALSRKLIHDDFRESLTKCGTPEELLALVSTI